MANPNSKPCPVSVIMAVHNGERHLDKAVSSILRQSFTNFEFIILNDGSTDKTPDILSAYKDPRILVMHQRHRGLTASLNTAVDHAKGEFIARIDADDVALRDRLHIQYDYMRAHPDIALLGSNCFIINEHDTICGKTSVPETEAALKWTLLFKNCLRHSSVMVRKKTLLECGAYNHDRYYAQDYDLWLTLARGYHIFAISETLTCYRAPGKGTITYENAAEQALHAEKVFMPALKKLLSDTNFSESDIRETRNFLIGETITGDLKKAERLFRDLYTAFSGSEFVRDLSAESLTRVRISPLLKFAWQYAGRGAVCDFNRCAAEAFSCGLNAPIDIPDISLSTDGITLLENAAASYAASRTGSSEIKQWHRDFLVRQYNYTAWIYYARRDIRNFRLYLYKSCTSRFSIKKALLVCLSLLGPWATTQAIGIKQALTRLVFGTAKRHNSNETALKPDTR